ncbi:MAG: 30S ribosomal protein S16 [Candidatus Niyogibacteria bacterium RIFCSPLOWO2_12_FULL_41_13]|uniref:30S ribosomal protein S16 n=1 Tax=Candidatus Niyogibacteria bacterium RIFCSPLOWO2_12_FULL_41_13 TaxID=1801726 RepID=A0A1G2F393_9BACT|nr:MAG: 30S ribosomal protein S16 [Candidatus Niyogibacteria bacterium RIFCSPLOWO2_12_FULL_41_13]
MLKIKLAKIGKKKERSFKLILTENRVKPSPSRYIEILGNYNPAKKTVSLDKERILHWISKGAQTSETVHNIFVKSGIIAGPKIRKGSAKKNASEAQSNPPGK